MNRNKFVYFEEMTVISDYFHTERSAIFMVDKKYYIINIINENDNDINSSPVKMLHDFSCFHYCLKIVFSHYTVLVHLMEIKSFRQ